jgi:hypothetical protein
MLEELLEMGYSGAEYDAWYDAYQSESSIPHHYPRLTFT